MPTPRRSTGFVVFLLNEDALFIACFHLGFIASKQLFMPTPVSNDCPVTVGSPFRRQLRNLKSNSSIPAADANSDSVVSRAIAVWGTPKPRNAPEFGVVVWMALLLAI